MKAEGGVEKPMMYNLNLDYDEYGWPSLLYGSDLLDIVRMDARRLIEFPEMGGIITIKRTLHGYHLRAPFAKLTKEEQDLATLISHADSGYKWWGVHHGKSTLRISEKSIVKQIRDEFVGRRVERDVPQVIEVIKKNE